MSIRDEQAVKLIVAKVLVELIQASDKTVRGDVAKGWVVDDRINGMVGGASGGTVQVKRGAKRAAITDAGAFEEWVQENRPDEWETVIPKPFTRVRPAFVTAVLDVAKKEGVAVTPQGEEIPGVTVSQAGPQVAVSLADDAAELVADAWASGELWEIVGGLLPQLEAGPGEVDG
ncbi:hypothetical protein [Acrocarpospora sp. B8E8]|uniref:hypothetical protein n=1 Tax=Acrocarpospora sp. B8E8 TaxID=3153572 RepID=UPI00325D82F1